MAPGGPTFLSCPAEADHNHADDHSILERPRRGRDQPATDAATRIRAANSTATRSRALRAGLGSGRRPIERVDRLHGHRDHNSRRVGLSRPQQSRCAWALGSARPLRCCCGRGCSASHATELIKIPAQLIFARVVRLLPFLTAQRSPGRASQAGGARPGGPSLAGLVDLCAGGEAAAVPDCAKITGPDRTGPDRTGPGWEATPRRAGPGSDAGPGRDAGPARSGILGAASSSRSAWLTRRKGVA